MSRIVIGIDAGLSGAYAALELTENGIEVHECRPLPIDDYGVSVIELSKSLFAFPQDSAVYIEDFTPRYLMSRQSVFTFGLNYGRVLSVLERREMAYERIAVATWQAHFGVREKRGKSSSIKLASERYPCVNTKPGKRRSAHDGMCDALLIATYGLEILYAATSARERSYESVLVGS